MFQDLESPLLGGKAKRKFSVGTISLIAGIVLVIVVTAIVVPIMVMRDGSPEDVGVGSRATTSGGPKGNVESVRNTYNGAIISGWACHYGEAQAISVHIYRKPGTQRSIIGGTTANKGGLRAGVSNACGTTGVPHGFSYTVSRAKLAAILGQPLEIFGLSLDRTKFPHRIFSPAGQWKLPSTLIPPPTTTTKAPTPAPTSGPGGIQGYVEAVTNGFNGVRIQGWACYYGSPTSIAVHLYRKRPDGTRQFIGGTYAKYSPGRTGVSRACGTTNRPHSFSYTIPRAKFVEYRGSPLDIFGISLDRAKYPHRIIPSPSKLKVLPSHVLYRLSEKKSGADVNIGAGERVIINSGNLNLGVISIKNGGRLECPSGAENLVMGIKGMLIDGKDSSFTCGTSSKPFPGRLETLVSRGKTISGFGESSIGVKNGGRLELYGDRKLTKWTRTWKAEVGSRYIYLIESVDWRVGDHIAIAPTRFNFREAERHKIVWISSDRKVLKLAGTLLYPHFGKEQVYRKQDGSRTWTLKSRAEVANLNRTIAFTSVDDSVGLIGGHILIGAGGVGKVDSIALNGMGQQGRMGRYPFHWHRAGNVNGQFIRNSVIVDSKQRCVTIHSSNNALVENNVCFNHFGHGFFLEDGNELGNRFIGNLGILSKRVPKASAILQSETISSSLQRQRFDSPSTFWVSNPSNVFVGNVAAGSEGTGFWMAYSYYLKCSSAGCSLGSRSNHNVSPAYAPTTQFDRNIVKAANVGFTWDGAPDGALANNPNNPLDRHLISSHYRPNGRAPEFRDLQASKCVYSGVYYRGDTSNFHNLVAADNGVSLFIAYSQKFINSCLVGESDNFSEEDRRFQRKKTLWPDKRLRGFVTYDGPSVLDSVYFAGFAAARVYSDNVEITPTPVTIFGGSTHYESVVIRSTFSNKPYYITDFTEKTAAKSRGWADARTTARIRDVDGSLFGKPGYLIVPNVPFLGHSSCTENARNGIMRCNYDMGVFHFGYSTMFPGKNKLKMQFNVRRSDGVVLPNYDESVYRLNNKFGVIVNKGYSYKIALDKTQIKNPGLFFHTPKKGTMSPILEFTRTNCGKTTGAVTGAKRLTSYSALKAHTGSTAWYRTTGGTMFVKAYAGTLDKKTNGAHRSIPIKITCA